MDIAYLKKRLAASIEMLNKASSTCARKAHEGLVNGHATLLLKRHSAAETLNDEAAVGDRELGTWADDGGQGAPTS